MFSRCLNTTSAAMKAVNAPAADSAPRASSKQATYSPAVAAAMDAVPKGNVQMIRIDVRRILAVLLLLLTLTPTLSWAGQCEEPRGEFLKSGLLTRLWSFVRVIWEQEGASLDPNGQPGLDEGGSLDPNGGTSDSGSSLDPNG